MDDLPALLVNEDADLSEDDEFDRVLTVGGVILLGLLDVQRRRSERHQQSRLYLTRPDLLPNPWFNTPWQRLYDGQGNRAYITTMGFDVATFNSILDSGFALHWNTTCIPREDVSVSSHPRLYRRSLDAAGALGLILHFLNSTMEDRTLSEIFALVPTSVSRYINFSLHILLSTLRKIDDAQIQWPQHNKFNNLNELVVICHQSLVGAFGTLDGLNLPLQTSSDQDIENATYNGWLHAHFVSSVLAFSASGLVIGCQLNAPGSWHDSPVAQPIYEKLRTETPEGFYLVADTAFPRGTDQIDGRIRAPMKEGTRLPLDPSEQAEILDFNSQLLSFRQTAEWGNLMLQRTFGRLCVPLLVSYTSSRGDILESCVCLYNLRTNRVGCNQIRTVYLPIWREDGQEVWDAFDKMLFRDQHQNDRVRRFHLSVGT